MSLGDEAVLNFYRLTEQPFGVTPDPRFLYLGPTHREALASLQQGISARRGFTALIARPGMGKTTLLWHLLENMQNTTQTAFLFQSQSTPREFLQSLLADLGIANDGQGLVEMHQKLNQALASTVAQPLVIVVDEAQTLAEPTLELLRMLSNFETPREKLIQIILAGHPRFAETLTSLQLVQLRQRISILARLEPLNDEETRLYINHRVRVVGYDFAKPLFDESALDLIARDSEGIPRNINNLCFHALSFACAKQQETIDAAVIQEVLKDLDIKPLLEVCDDAPEVAEPRAPLPSLPTPSSPRSEPMRRPMRWPLRLALGTCVVLLVLFGWPLFAPKGSIPIRFSSRNHQEDPKPLAAPVSAIATEKQGTSPVSVESTSLPASPLEESHSAAQAHAVETKTVTVLPGQTLYRICVHNLGRYDDEVLTQIRALNPELGDATHIKVGQALLLPLMQPPSKQIEPAAGHIVRSVAGKDLVTQ